MTAVPIESLSTPLAYALAYARLGWHVLPIEPATKRPHKLAPRGLHSATANQQQLREWWTAAPDAGIAINCQASRLVVLDIDPRNGGLFTVERLEQQYGTLASDVMAITPGGGIHYVYAAGGTDLLLPGTLGPGVDVKWAGYVLVEPSLHPNGKTYGWEASSSPLEGARPSPLPALFGDFAARPAPAQDGQERFVPISEQTWSDIYSTLLRIGADERDTWYRVGMALHSTGEPDRAFALWDEWSKTSKKYDPRDQVRVWRSFKGVGLDGITYRTIFGMAKAIGVPAPVPALSHLGTGFVSAEQFAASAASPDYVLDGVLRRGYLYALTGMSNADKTSIGLRIARCVSLGEPFGSHECVRGAVLILAGENPDDVAYRFIAEAQHNSMSPVGKTFPGVTVLPFSFAIEAGLPFIQEQARRDGGYALVLVDSKAAYFSGDSEDDNAQAFRHARFLRELTTLEGRPSALVICHPIKRPTGPDDLLPRGGSAFLNEIDGNLTAWREGGADIVRMHYTKIRGVPFDPVHVRLAVVELGSLKTSAGKPVTSVVALPTTHEDAERDTEHAATAEDTLLGVIYDKPKATQRAWAKAAGWVNDKGEPHTGRLSRVLKALKEDKLISKPRSSKNWKLTQKGAKEVEASRGKASADNICGGAA